MNQDAKQARNEYMKNYYKTHKEQMHQQQKKWVKNNPEKVKCIIERYWENKSRLNKKSFSE